MALRQRTGHVELLRCNSLDREGVVHAITTRSGGVSPAPWDTLNLSWARPDTVENVLENRRRICTAIEVPLDRLVQAGQVHGIGVRVVGAAEAGRGAVTPASLLPPSDALITDASDVYLFACFADCVPLLFYDPCRPAVGVAHAGWRGTVAGTAAATVRAFAEHFGTRPADLRVVIGPSIGPCCYEVGPEVIVAVQERLPTAPDLLSRCHGATAYFDLWKANHDQLIQAGVLDDHIEVSGLCTAHHTDTFFSHRATGGATGRFAAVIGLRPVGSSGGHVVDGQ